MYCPQCGLEYRDDVTLCTECGVPLTSEPPEVAPEPTAEWRDLDVVLETSDAAQLAVAKSLLEAEGIPCFARGDLIQEFFGLGRMASGTNMVTGPVKLEVPRERSAEARELLSAADPARFELPAGEPSEE